MAYERIIAYIDSEILILQQARALLAQERRPKRAKRRQAKPTIPEKSATGAIMLLTPTAKKIDSLDETVRNSASPASAKRRRKHRVRERASVPTSALTHKVPAGPVVVSRDEARKARERSHEPVDAECVSVQVVQPAPELTEGLLKERWILGSSLNASAERDSFSSPESVLRTGNSFFLPERLA